MIYCTGSFYLGRRGVWAGDGEGRISGTWSRVDGFRRGGTDRWRIHDWSSGLDLEEERDEKEAGGTTKKEETSEADTAENKCLGNKDVDEIQTLEEKIDWKPGMWANLNPG